MNLKKKVLGLITIITFAIFILMQNIVYAQTATGSEIKYFEITEKRQTGDQYGYGIGKPGDGNSEDEKKNGAKIWNIVKYSSSAYTDPKDGNIYCLKAEYGTGFKTSLRRATYNLFFDMKTEKTQIAAQNSILKEITEGQVDGADKYNALLALGDLVYIKDYSATDSTVSADAASTESEKAELLRSAKIRYITDDEIQNAAKYIKENVNENTITEEQREYIRGLLYSQAIDDDEIDEAIKNIKSADQNNIVEYVRNLFADGTLDALTKLTDEDIIAIQQAAIWYFTNNDVEKYNRYNNSGWFSYTTDGNTYTNFTDGRKDDAEKLYKYLIDTAKANASMYVNTDYTKAPAVVDTTTLNYEESGSNYIVGPIHITKNNDIPYTIEFNVKNGETTINNYKLLNSNKQEVTSGTTVKDLVGQDFYIAVSKDEVTTLNIDMKINYSNTKMTLWANGSSDEQPVMIPEKEQKSIPTKLTVTPEVKKYFDLKLIKRITAVNNQNVPERIENIDVTKLADGTATTADYKLNKNPVGVKKGDIVTYTLRVYNEGDIDGYASEITEDIPEGLQFLWSEKTGEELKADTTLTDEEKAAIEFNQNKFWTYADNTLKTVKTDYLSRDNETVPGDGTNLIKAFDKTKGYLDTTDSKNPDYKEVSIMLKVISDDTTGTIIRNEACISEDTDKDGNSIDDRDSKTDEWKEHPNHEDDEDHDYITLQSFDLALRKFIIAVSDDEEIQDSEYLKNANGLYKRAPEVDTSKLNTKDENGKLITTAIYNHTKEPLLVQKNNIVVYNLRVYNEGDMDGYASEIKDHLPSYLEFVDGEFNKKYGWEVSEDGRTVTTRYLENSLIKAATLNEKAEEGASNRYILAYKEVPIMCKVKDTAKTSENITNIADITEYLDSNKKDVTDRDSQPDNVKLPDDKDLPGYKDNEKGDYIPGQQDDDDFEKVIVKEFDLAMEIKQLQKLDINHMTILNK